MSLNFDKIELKVDNRVVELGTSEIPIFAIMATSWDDIPDKPETFPPEPHDHDDRYFTEDEITTKLNAKANLKSPTFTGTPKAPTASKGTNTTQLATTAFVATGLADKQDALTFDTVPTASSSNPVTSDGIKTALDGKVDVITQVSLQWNETDESLDFVFA